MSSPARGKCMWVNKAGGRKAGDAELQLSVSNRVVREGDIGAKV